jgi:hypothetical protein
LVTPGEGVGVSHSRYQGTGEYYQRVNRAPGWDGRSCISSMQESVEIKCKGGDQRAEIREQRSESGDQILGICREIVCGGAAGRGIKVSGDVDQLVISG